LTENRRIENKRELTDNLEKEVVGFLNSHDGGEIHIGVDDSGRVTGLDDADAIQLKVKDRLKNNIQPSIMGLFDIFLERIEEKMIVRIIVASGLEKPYFLRKYGMTEKISLSPRPHRLTSTICSRWSKAAFSTARASA